MIYERFRAGETTAKPAWNDGALVRCDGDRRPARAQQPAPPRDDRVRQRAAAMIPQSRSSWAGASMGQQECCDIPARPSFGLPRLRICYTARNRGRSAKPARSLLTELFRPYTSA
jgi:hypothetical protein